MRYTIKQMQAEFPDNDTCLQFLFERRYGDMKACPKCGVDKPSYYRVKKRTAYECKDCGYQIYPLVGTIFEKSTTPLTDWFHAIYLVSISKNGVAAKELERHIGVSYKTAHRMEKMIRLLMREEGRLGFLGSPVEVDEAYVKGKGKHKNYHDNSTPVMAAVEVGGEIRTKVVDRVHAESAAEFLESTVYSGVTLHTDEARIYKAKRIQDNYKHASVRHVAQIFKENGVTTNHVEGFFGQMKRSIDGTYHCVSPRYLDAYVSEFAYRYNHRNQTIFPLLLEAAALPR